jgi:beta-xylosidase
VTHAPASWGDQGDGTYRNPVLNADYPDVDIERVGDVYTLMTSTMHYAPGMTLAQSRDLVNWTLIGHVFEKLDWEPEYNWDRMGHYSFGVWAGDLAYNDGRWYCYFIDYVSGLYVSSAPEVTGPWSRPTCMLRRTRWTDPAVTWDHDTGQAWLVCNCGIDPAFPGRGNEIRLFRMSWNGTSLLDDGQPIYRGPGAEAARICKVDGFDYLFLAEWRDNDRKQIVLRGRTLSGPLERRVVMERAPELDRSCCQGALVQAPDDSWWLTHQLVQHRVQGPDGVPGPSTDRSYEGRSQWLVPVTWKDGWPIPGEVRPGASIACTVHRARKPLAGLPVAAPAASDDFDAPVLGPQWQWNHNPRDDRWSLRERPGWLRLRASVPAGAGGFWNAANTVSQRLMGTGRGVADARLDIAGVVPGQRAGFCHHSGQYALIGVMVCDNGTRRLVFDHDGAERLGPQIDGDILHLRTNIDGDRATLAWSTDGSRWNGLGWDLRLRFGRWRGDRLGFYCWNDKADAGHVDIDWFRYAYDGPLGDLASLTSP